ncbi:MAG TPA: HAD-IA family hydrolase [Rhodanobacteraceae bacterium]|jgi:HAD superfamily hydrolase (TIGR01509 family)|nr:HAD-IA family hydrolase [Rhodanobacteraceae bacterium]
MPIDAVIFDCDGTLVDSELLANEVLVEYAAGFGVPITLEEALQCYVGGKMADCVADMERRLGRKLPDSFVPELRARTAEIFRERLQAMEGAAEMLEALQVPCCVASSGPREKIELSLGLTGLLPRFEGRIFSAYEVGHWKPDPRLLLHAAEAMGVPPKHCAVVEDSLPGIRAGLAAGMTTFAFRWRGALPESAIALERLQDLPRLIAARRTS